MAFDFRKLVKWSVDCEERMKLEEQERLDRLKDEWPFSFKLAAGAPRPFQIKPILESIGIEFYNEFYTFRFKELEDMNQALAEIKRIHTNVPLIN